MKYKVTLNKRVYEVEVEQGEAMLMDEYDAVAPVPVAAPAAAPVAAAPVAAAAPVPAAAPAPAAVAAGEVVKSPMPGNILKIQVSQGQQVKEGDVLIILEAMKMENEIVAPKAGSVAQIIVTKGQVVETGAPLAVIA